VLELRQPGWHRWRDTDRLGPLLLKFPMRLFRNIGKLGRVAIDGTKIRASTSRHKAMSFGRMDQAEAQLETGPFAEIKQAMRSRRFATRGCVNIRDEWDLVCAAANALTLPFKDICIPFLRIWGNERESSENHTAKS
jgi:hypothetical protein